MKKMLIGLGTFTAMLTFALTSVPNVNNVSAATEATTSVAAQSDSAVPADVQSVDQYVTVEDNQYVLDATAKSQLTKNVYDSLTNQLAKANELVTSDHSYIDPVTKSFDYGITVRSDKPTTKDFWWGKRYYMRSNAQVDTMVYTLNTWSNRNYSLSGIPYVGAILSWNGARLNQAALDLDRYNKKHIKSHIYMDINGWLGNYSFGTF